MHWERPNIHPFDIEVYSIALNKCVKSLHWEVCQFPDSLDVSDAPWTTNFSWLCYGFLTQAELWYNKDLKTHSSRTGSWSVTNTQEMHDGQTGSTVQTIFLSITGLLLYFLIRIDKA